MKELLAIDLDDVSKDTILNFHLDNAKSVIESYLNIELTDEDEIRYKNVIVELAIYYRNNFEMTGIKSSTVGRVSKSYEDSYIPKDIKAKLPSPYVRIMG